MSVIIIGGEGLFAGRPASGVVPPSVSTVTPNTAFKLGPGVQIAITGGPFVNGAGLAASVDSVPCTNVTWVSATTITATTGAISSDGFKDVRVTNPNGGTGTLTSGYLALQSFMWLRALAGDYVLDANGKLATWSDLSSSGNSIASQGANQGPAPIANAFGSKQGIRFSTGGDFMQRTSFSGPAVSEVLIVKKSASSGQQGLWTAGSSNTQDWNPFGDFHVYDSWGSTVRKDTGIPPGFSVASAWQAAHLWSARSAAGAYAAAINGADYYSNNSNVVGWNGTFILGKNSIGTGFIGDVAEMTAFSRFLSTMERTWASNFLKASWSVPSTS